MNTPKSVITFIISTALLFGACQTQEQGGYQPPEATSAYGNLPNTESAIAPPPSTASSNNVATLKEERTPPPKPAMETVDESPRIDPLFEVQSEKSAISISKISKEALKQKEQKEQTASHSTNSILLADFDSPSGPMLEFPATFTTANYDDDADAECRIAAPGFNYVMRLVPSRHNSASLFNKYPIMSMRCSAIGSENPGKFLRVCFHIQTDVTGEDVFEEIKGPSLNPIQAPGERLSLDIRTAHSETFPSILDTIQRFSNGEGDFLRIAVVQHTSKGITSVVYYDDLTLSSN